MTNNAENDPGVSMSLSKGHTADNDAHTVKQCGWCAGIGHTTDEHNAVCPGDPRPAAEIDVTPGEWLGGCSGTVAEAVTFAREVASEWGPVTIRLDGGRTPGDSPGNADALLWTVCARVIPPGSDPS